MYFENKEMEKTFFDNQSDQLFWVNTEEEITTDLVDKYVGEIKQSNRITECVIAIGGGSTLDVGKAVANLLNNPGKAEDYQGWDLVEKPGVYKIGVPTISGTGAEASRTCVMMNYKKNLKLGMNSEHTLYDQLILDPALTKTVPKEQYFYTGMDAYVHCIESLAGDYRHMLADAFSNQALKLCREVFLSEDMMSDDNRDKLMTASYLGGSAVANSYVGIVHPLSAGLSVVLGIHHCEANCIVMSVMDEFYPEDTKEFLSMLDKQNVKLKKGVCSNLTDDQYERLYESSIIHEVPLKNALGNEFKKILTKEKVLSIYKRM